MEETGQWPEGHLDAYITMIPKADGEGSDHFVSSLWFTSFRLQFGGDKINLGFTPG